MAVFEPLGANCLIAVIVESGLVEVPADKKVLKLCAEIITVQLASSVTISKRCITKFTFSLIRVVRNDVENAHQASPD